MLMTGWFGSNAKLYDMWGLKMGADVKGGQARYGIGTVMKVFCEEES